MPYPSLRNSSESLFGAAGLLPAGFTVYHGTPHKFTQFDSSKIGTGEGAQAYGHGLYFAENPETAGVYSRTLGSLVTYKGKATGDFIESTAERRALDAIEENILSGIDKKNAIENAGNAWRGNPKVSEFIKNLNPDDIAIKKGGRVINADIHPTPDKVP